MAYSLLEFVLKDLSETSVLTEAGNTAVNQQTQRYNILTFYTYVNSNTSIRTYG